MAKDYKIVDKVLIIEPGRTEIGGHEFFNQKIEKVIIPEGVTKIGYWAFGGCKTLREIVLPTSLVSIAREAFAMCPLNSITFTDGCPKLKEIYIGSFSHNCPWLRQQLKGNEFISFHKTLFMHRSGNKSVVIPEGFDTIGEHAFCEDVMEEVVIPEGVKTIGRQAFSLCSKLKSMELPKSVETVEDYAFFRCDALTQIVFPDNVKTIGAGALGNCKSLQKVVFPEKLKSIGENLFTNGYLKTKVKLTDIDSLIPAMLNGCKVNTKTTMWLLENLWQDENSLKQIVVVYLTQSGTKVLAQAELIMWRNPEKTAAIMTELKTQYKLRPAVLKKIDAYLEQQG